MTDGGQAILPVPRARGIVVFAIAVVFLAVRFALLAVRDPFFDELFTLWMARQPLSHVIPNLLHDSGPPLYYFIARFDSITALRLLSLLFATMQFVLVVRRSLLAGALLALYPPAALFAVDGRAYSLCAWLVTAGVCALIPVESGRPARSERASRAVIVPAGDPRGRSLLLALPSAIAKGHITLGARSSRYFAAICFALAAHSHYYGVLFFPLLLLPFGQKTEDRGPRTEDKILSLGLAILLFLPGFLLASKQPVAATKWNHEPLFAPLMNLSFSGTYPYALFASAPAWLAVLALVVLVVAVSRSARFAAAVLVPLALVFAFHVAGRPVYFPMRFDAVIAGPLMLWLGDSLGAWQLPWRRALAGSLAVIGAIAIVIGVVDHERRPMDPYRQAALALRQHTKAGDTVVATGYLYLETVTALDRPVIAWPAEQAQHPGWRATTHPDPASLPTVPFVWIGERYAPEITTLRGVKALRPLFWNERALVAQASNLTAPVH